MKDQRRPTVYERTISDRKFSILKPLELDDILVKELGQFGPFQIRILCLVFVPVAITGFLNDFIFVAAPTPHRCRIPECEFADSSEFSPDWLSYAIPKITSVLSSCERFAPLNHNLNDNLNFCQAVGFNHSNILPCKDLVYETNNTIIYQFDLGCKAWGQALVGTISNVGMLLVLPVTGYISDRFGRKTAIVINAFNLSIIGIVKAFSINYSMFLILQLLQASLGGGLYGCGYIIATEYTGPKYRVLASVVISSSFAMGQMLLGGIAWIVQPWQYLTLALYAPCILVISYYWILPESVRWLLLRQKFDDAKELLVKIAKENKKNVSVRSLDSLTSPTLISLSKLKKEENPIDIISIFKSSVLLRRVFTTPIWWVSTTFVYYGLSINMANFSKTMYLNYILVCAIEIPGYIVSASLLNRIGRKWTLASGFFFCAACNIAFHFIPQEMDTTRLIVYMFGKFGISMVFTALYLFTSELYPTELRHTLLGFSSMIGRIGGIIVPFTPILSSYWSGLPSMLFASFALLSGALVLTQPETMGHKMPDTLEEAEAIGKAESKT